MGISTHPDAPAFTRSRRPFFSPEADDVPSPNSLSELRRLRFPPGHPCHGNRATRCECRGLHVRCSREARSPVGFAYEPCGCDGEPGQPGYVCSCCGRPWDHGMVNGHADQLAEVGHGR